MDPQEIIYQCQRCERRLPCPVPAKESACPYCGFSPPLSPSFSELLDVAHRTYEYQEGVPVPKNPEKFIPDPFLLSEISRKTEEIQKQYEDERRLKVVCVPERLLFDLFTLPTRLPDRIAVLDCDPLPDGTKVLPGAHHDLLRRCFLFFVQHPSFEPVHEGCEPPFWPGLGRMRLVRVTPDT